MSTLLALADDVRALDQLLNELAGGEITPEIEQAVTALLTETGDAFHAKVDSYCGLIRQLELTAAARREEAERLEAGARTVEGRARWLKERLKATMQSLGMTKAGWVRTATICQAGGLLPLFVECDPALLPKNVQCIQVDANKDEIRKRLEAGERIEGCRLGERGSYLRVR